jgi:ATP-dependent exoDNAse (exonuclease V) beta subunit
VVILTAIDDLSAAEETALLYVGLSRARAHFVLIATDATMQRLRLARPDHV